MTGLVVLTAAILGSLAYRQVEQPALLAALAAVTAILALAAALAHGLARSGARPTFGAPLDRTTAAAREQTAEPVEKSKTRRNMESALEQYAQQQRMFAAAAESASYPIITVTVDGTITAWNPAAENLYRYTSAEAIGQNIAIIAPADHRAAQAAMIEKSLREELVENVETVRQTRSGRRIDVALSIRPVRSRSGEIIGAAKVTRDLTAQKFAEEKFRLAVESAPCGMVMTNRRGEIVMVNTEIERLFGHSRDELIGRPVDILVPTRLRNQHARLRDDFIRHPKTHRMGAGRDLFGRRRDGTEFPVEVVLNPIHTGERLLVLGVIVDISERKRLERLKDEFVSTVSHELRTPLTSISGSLGLLIGGAAGKLPDSAARLLAIAQSNSQRLVRLINDILDIEKMESSQIVFNFKPIEALTLVEQTIEGNRGFADGYGVRVRLDPSSASGQVHGDPDRLAQVITNLLSNAIKFSPPGGEVVVAVEKRDDTIRISVRDHGPGIPPEFKEHIFEKFAQADATDARQKGGTGLGLSIVKEIVTRLGGEVGFDDAPGGGTVFFVDLPGLDQVAGREIDLEAKPGAARILLCEDDPNAAIALREGLQQFGFATDFAHTRAEAVMRAAAAPYGAILVDLQLPDGDGAGLIRDLQEQPQSGKSPPIIAMSADSDRDHEVLSGLEPMGLEWLEKPVDLDRLAQMLDRLGVRDTGQRPEILHVDDDRDVLDLVALALNSTANVTSANSIEDARRALAAHHFDLAVLDIELGGVSGLDLLPDLRGSRGRSIPVIIFSAHGTNPVRDPQVQASLGKSQAALDSLVATVHDRLTPRSSLASQEVV
ncbi:MAG TPA: PAS domain S-box protein [Xanthobacteraceae bacterium]